MKFKEAKQIIINTKNGVNYSNNSAIRGKNLKTVLNIFQEFRPDLYDLYVNKKVNLKRILIYCFINDLKYHNGMRFFKFDSELNRIINLLTLKEFAYIHRPQGARTDKVSLSKIYDAGLDLTYPKLINYSCEKVNKICNRLVVEHFNCKVCGKVNKKRFKGNITCGIACQAKLSSDRMKKDNPVWKMSQEQLDTIAKNNSKRMKEKIANGKFTPCVTNSWANSKVNLRMFDIPFRSSWEAYFYAKMTKENHIIEYEKVRIKYFDTVQNKYRNYITDFVDYKNRKIYEVKPEGCKDTQNVSDKETTAKEWCKDNNFEFIYISECWFKENYNIILLEELNNEKVWKGMKQFENN